MCFCAAASATSKTRVIASCFLSRFALGILAAVVSFRAIGVANEPEQGKEDEARREQHLNNMKRSAAQYVLSSADAPKRVFEFQETPVMRFSNPVSGTTDGALYVWTNHGRPEAILKLYTFSNKIYTHAWLSLSENDLVAARNGGVIWRPSKPGIKLRAIPDAPVPAETAAERLRQMKALSARFSATYTALRSDGKPFELRVLTQPLFRYETDDEFRADGALFGYVQSTAPVGLLLLESRQSDGGRRWHYAYSSLTSGLVTARYADQEVFSLERGNDHRDPQQPYLLLHSLPVPKE
jgi:hypothetical protein